VICYRDLPPDGREIVFAERRERHPVHLDLARVRLDERVHVLQEDALSRATAAEDDERLPGEHVEREPTQHVLRRERLVERAAADVRRPLAHESRKSFVRKKSEMRTVTDAATTVCVVARPTPSAPPVTVSPL